MLSCSIWFYAPSFWMGGGLESRCVGRVYGADGALRLARHHPHRKHGRRNGKTDKERDGRRDERTDIQTVNTSPEYRKCLLYKKCLK